MDVHVSPLLSDEYLRRLYSGRGTLREVLRGFSDRYRQMLLAAQFDVLWIEKELLPWLPASFEINLLPPRARVLVDYDDAIFHRYDQHPSTVVRALLGKKIDKVMARADVVLAGNDYLASHARTVGARRVEILPTVVDLDRYSTVKLSTAIPRKITVGWIGSPATCKYLRFISDVMFELSQAAHITFEAIGASHEQVSDLPVAVVPWSEDREIECIRKFDIGIMPLPDEPFERGKCGYKLIQYMACGIPVVASPVGANTKIVKHGVNGFLATTQSEWRRALTTLASDSALRSQMGMAGRKQVEEQFNLTHAAQKMATILQSMVS
jgi:glycosyltransferase involved in cell wall biosynthesis